MAQRDDTRAREAMSDAALADHAADLWRERGKRPDETMALREVMGSCGVAWGAERTPRVVVQPRRTASDRETMALREGTDSV